MRAALFCISRHLNGDSLGWASTTVARKGWNEWLAFPPASQQVQKLSPESLALQVWFICDITNANHINLAVELFDDLLYFSSCEANINDNGNPRYRFSVVPTEILILTWRLDKTPVKRFRTPSGLKFTATFYALNFTPTSHDYSTSWYHR